MSDAPADDLPTVPYESTESPRHLPAHLERISTQNFSPVNEGFWIVRDAAARLRALEAPPADDLVERLRALKAYLHSAAHGTDAFDADLAALDQAIALRQKLEKAERRGETWCNQAQDFHADLGREHAALTLAQSQRDALAKAAEPFIRELDIWADDAPPHKRWAACGEVSAFTLGDLRALASARAQAMEGSE